MRRPTAIVLALMGGGAVLWGVNRGPSRACLDARAEARPNAEAICSSSGGSSGGHGGSGYRSASYSSPGSVVAAVARGGFGGSAHAAGS